MLPAQITQNIARLLENLLNDKPSASIRHRVAAINCSVVPGQKYLGSFLSKFKID